MCDGLITTQDVQEGLSRAFLAALVAKSRYVLSEPQLDRDGIDLVVEAGSDFRPKIAFQLKATTLLKGDADADHYKYACPVKNYNKLVIKTQTPRLLMLYRMPSEEDRWLEFLEDEALLRHCAYWVNLRGRPESNLSSNITIEVPKANRLTVDTLRSLMQQSRTGVL